MYTIVACALFPNGTIDWRPIDKAGPFLNATDGAHMPQAPLPGVL